MAVSLGSITSANTSFVLSVAGIFSSPQVIQQYAAEESFEADAIENGEIVKGVDNFMAAGWVPTMPRLTVTLQANSPSNNIFDQWFASEQQQRDKFLSQGLITVPGTRTQWTILNAYLFSYTPVPAGKKVLQPRKFILIMDEFSPAPF